MLLKTPPLYFLLLLISTQFLSCTKQDKKSSAFSKKPTVTSLIMEPNTEDFPELTAADLNYKKNKINHFFQKNLASKNTNISFLVAQNGKIIYEKYAGTANFAKKRPITSTTPIHIASVSKVLTATVILKLINAGKLKLDQKANTILKDLPYPDITIENLLNHRTGMRNYAYFTSEKGNWNQHKILSNQDIINVINAKNIKLEHKTGTRFSYCNTNYALLALIIEKVTKKTYAEAMKTMLFHPLGMKNTFVYNYKTDQDTVVPSYRFTNRKVAFDYLDGIYGDKNIYSTPQDLLKFDLARNSPYFLTPELRSKIYEGYSNEHKGEKNYGLGIRMIEWKTGQKFYFHNGWWHGNMSAYVTLKKENTVIIALTNNYSKQVYRVRNLAPIFGDYPFKVMEDYE